MDDLANLLIAVLLLGQIAGVITYLRILTAGLDAGDREGIETVAL